MSVSQYYAGKRRRPEHASLQLRHAADADCNVPSAFKSSGSSSRSGAGLRAYAHAMLCATMRGTPAASAAATRFAVPSRPILALRAIASVMRAGSRPAGRSVSSCRTTAGRASMTARCNACASNTSTTIGCVPADASAFAFSLERVVPTTCQPRCSRSGTSLGADDAGSASEKNLAIVWIAHHVRQTAQWRYRDSRRAQRTVNKNAVDQPAVRVLQFQAMCATLAGSTTPICLRTRASRHSASAASSRRTLGGDQHLLMC